MKMKFSRVQARSAVIALKLCPQGSGCESQFSNGLQVCVWRTLSRTGEAAEAIREIVRRLRAKARYSRYSRYFIAIFASPSSRATQECTCIFVHILRWRHIPAEAAVDMSRALPAGL